MATPVPGKERHRQAGHEADRHRVGRLAERGGRHGLGRVFEQFVEPAATDDPDLRLTGVLLDRCHVSSGPHVVSHATRTAG